MERAKNKVTWVKGSILSYDYVVTPNEIYFVKIVPTITWPVFSAIITVVLVIVIGPRIFIPAAVAAVFISTVITQVLFTLIRHRVYKLSLENLVNRKGVKRITFSNIQSIDSKGTVISIVTRDGASLSGRMKKSDIQLVKLYASSPKG